MFLGPLIGAGFVVSFGVQSVFYIHAAACLMVFVVLAMLPDPARLLEQSGGPGGAAAGRTAPTAVGGLSPTSDLLADASVRAHAPVLVRLGTGVAMLSVVRASKVVIVPLWGAHMGLTAAQVAIIVGVSAGVELVPFYAAGQLMDRFGRLSAILPCLLGLAMAHALLPLADSFTTLMWAAVGLGFVNGIGSGIQLTLGSDIAPRSSPAPVLAAWRLFGDAGSAVAPLMIAGIIAAASLPAATLTVAAVGLVGSGVMARYVPRFVPRRSKRLGDGPPGVEGGVA